MNKGFICAAMVLGATSVLFPSFAHNASAKTNPSLQKQDEAWGNAHGRVTEVNGTDFTIVTGGGRKLRVQTKNMPYYPLDKKGAQVVRQGERVYVAGKIQAGTQADEIEANSIITLSKGR